MDVDIEEDNPLIGEYVESSSCCCPNTSKKSPSSAKNYKKCCGVKRRLVCGGRMYCPPRRTHDEHQSYANILLPISLILIGLSITATWFMIRGHEYLHSNLKILLYTTIGSGIIFAITIIITALCVLSFWKSTTCIHYEFMGDFEDTEENYVTGSKFADDIESGARGIAFFTQVPPSSNDKINQSLSKNDLFDIHASDMDTEVVWPQSEKWREGLRREIQQQAPSLKIDAEKEAAEEIKRRKDIFFLHAQRLSQAKSVSWMADSAPFFACCIDTKLSEIDDEYD